MDNYLCQGYVLTRICLIISRITERALNQFAPNAVEGVDVGQGRTRYILGQIRIIYYVPELFSLKSDVCCLTLALAVLSEGLFLTNLWTFSHWPKWNFDCCLPRWSSINLYFIFIPTYLWWMILLWRLITSCCWLNLWCRCRCHCCRRLCPAFCLTSCSCCSSCRWLSSTFRDSRSKCQMKLWSFLASRVHYSKFLQSRLNQLIEIWSCLAANKIMI